MVDMAQIKQWKKEGQIIITNETFQKLVEFRNMNNQADYVYQGKNYKGHDWLLTYNHKLYQRLLV